MPPPAPALACLIGPTAAGKSELALELAERFGAEILSLDSMQVYRGMDVGTAKPGAAERARVRHHLLDLVEPSERYDLARYLADFAAAAEDCARRGVRALAVGGSGLYLQALLRGVFGGPPPDPALRAALRARAQREGAQALHAELARVDPRAAQAIHPHDEKRVVRALEVWSQAERPISALQVQWREPPRTRACLLGIDCPPAALDARIRARTRAMLDQGWAEEAAAVRSGPGFGPTASQALGYAEALGLFDGALGRAEAEERIARRTRQLARRQRTWFRRFAETVWIAPEEARAERADWERLGAALGWSAAR